MFDSTPFLFCYKRNLNSNSGKMVLCGMSPSFSWFVGSLNKAAIHYSNNSSLHLLSCSEANCACLAQIAFEFLIFNLIKTILRRATLEIYYLISNYTTKL